jgi:hypothetical protein
MSPRVKVDLDQVAEKCALLQLHHVAATLPELLEQASREDLPPQARDAGHVRLRPGAAERPVSGPAGRRQEPSTPRPKRGRSSPPDGRRSRAPAGTGVAAGSRCSLPSGRLRRAPSALRHPG